jgi:hypothetical protein
MDRSFKQNKKRTGRREEKINSRHKTKQNKKTFVRDLDEERRRNNRKGPSHANYGNAPIAIGHHHFFPDSFLEKKKRITKLHFGDVATRRIFFFSSSSRVTRRQTSSRGIVQTKMAVRMASVVVVVRDPLKENLQLFLEVAKKGVRV